ncbi:iron complex outermembrane receptor protein [Altererythrobacter atlanticus]|uniref:TonB-dependent receptor n=1 Tax=Croceibacterium atlanticum TaxID=1267766 RepID=UPI0017FFEBFC|nr:TonB-dependent receptor [Croceibacterium atlanticum]MBB5734089.1 iron complex outermembrane receptor protein [Croceibacterium atlanticum]
MRRSLAGSISLFAICAASPAIAQDQPVQEPQAQPANGVEEIVVTAQFREQNLQDTPLAITAVSSDMLEARSQTNVAEVAAQAPSVSLKPQGSSYGPSIAASIRGVGQYDFNPALEPGVGLYIDDVYYATLTGSLFDLLDLDRVEILRGPQGTLAGRNSIGGAVKLYSKRPTGSNTGYVSATYGIRDRLDLRASADFGLTDTLSTRISGVSKSQDGYIKRMDFGCVYPAGESDVNPEGGVTATLPYNSDCVSAREGEVNFEAVRGQLRWEPTSRLDINIAADYTHDDRNNGGSVLVERRNAAGEIASPYYPYPANPSARVFDINPYEADVPYDSRFVCGPYCNFANYAMLADNGQPALSANGRTKFEGWGVSGQVDWDVTDSLQLVSISAYREYRSQFTNDDAASPLSHSLGISDLTFWSFSQEVRLNGIALDDRLEYTVGGFYMDQRSVYGALQSLRYSGLDPFIQDDPVNADTKAAFAHVSWNPIDPLTLTAGIRYTDEHKDYTYVRRTLDGGVHPQLGALDGVTGTYDHDRVDYRLNAMYEITPEISVYGQWSTGFKGGGINPRPFFAQQVLSFDPETLESFEVGFKSDLFDRMMRLNLAAFYSNYNGIQLALNNCPQAGAGFAVPCSLPSNAGDAHVKGFEVETSLRPVDGFVIDGTVSYVDFDYVADSLEPASGIQPDMVSNYTPKWKWSIGAQYEALLGSAGSITPRFDASYQSDIYTNAINGPTNKIDDYIVANARLTWKNEDEDLELGVEVTNLFDKYYFQSLFDLTRAGAGFVTGLPGRPREWAVTAKKKF